MTFKITESQATALTFIEQVWWLEQTLPTEERVADAVGVKPQTVKKWMENESFIGVLHNKGIVKQGPPQVLTPQQLLLVNSLLNLGDRRTVREKCEDANVKTAQYAAWRRDPAFIGYLHKRAETLYRDGQDEAVLTLMKAISSGDMGATRLYFEMTGKYTPKTEHHLSVDTILAQVIEVIQTRVKDPAVLEAIADDFDSIMAGRPIEREIPPIQQFKVLETTAQLGLALPSVKSPEPELVLNLGSGLPSFGGSDINGD